MKYSLNQKVSVMAMLAGVFGCANMSALQTAKTMPAGDGRVLVGGGYYASPSVNEGVGDVTGEEADLKFPYLEVGYRRGIVENFELGAKATLPGTIAVDGKYQLVNTGRFALAGGLGAGYLSLSSGEGEEKTTTRIIDVTVPVYASFDLGEYVALYTSPKYLLRMTSGDTSGTGHLAGATGGVRLGNGTGVFVEGTYLRDLKADFNAVQVNGSFYF